MSKSKATSDLFVSYASDDADLCTNDLTMALWEVGVTSIWIDRLAIKHGDSIPRRVDEGLSSTRYLLPIVTPKYFVKPWTKRELDAVRMLEKPSLPIWVNVNSKAVASFSPTLAAQKALIYKDNPYEMAEKIAEFLKADKRTHFYKSSARRDESKLFWQLAWVYTLDVIKGEDFTARDFVREKGDPDDFQRFMSEIRSAIKLTPQLISDRASVIRKAAEELGNRISDEDVAHIIVGYAKRAGSSFAYELQENKALRLIGLETWN